MAQNSDLQVRLQKSNALISKLFGGDEISVLNGPFEGLMYIDSSNGSQLLPKLVGSYEEPIHRWIYEILEKKDYSTIVDVGCAEGYYAVGFSRARSKPKILAFDVDKDALVNAMKLAKLNGVSDDIFFYEQFDASICSEILNQDNEHKKLIFMDVEGAELDLLDTTKTPAILNCDVLVELHDCFYPGLTEIIIERFQESHTIEIVVDYPWRAENYFLNGKVFSEEDKYFMFNERRPKAMRWMYAKVK